jgi:ABC-2 type transport system permease protein
MIRVMAMIERDLRRYVRSPALVTLSVVMPLLQLVILGYAFGGKVKNVRVGVVDRDHGVPALQLQEMFQAVAAGPQTFTTVAYADPERAMRDLREGRISAVLEIPPEFSRSVLAGAGPRLALIEDNVDQFASGAVQAALQGVVGEFNRRRHPERAEARLPGEAALSVVELYPYVPYIRYLLPGMITLAIFSSAMIGGGIIFIDDKSRGLHEGYLVTPITKFELILGFNLAGVVKATVSGILILVIGMLVAGVPDPWNVARLARTFLLILVTALALISMMFLLVSRMSDPLIPRMLFGVLNILMFNTSGAQYPIYSFPGWMRVLTAINPFTYAVDGFKSLLLKNTGFAAVGFDILFLLGFSAVAMAAATKLFRRTL